MEISLLNLGKRKNKCILRYSHEGRKVQRGSSERRCSWCRIDSGR